MVDRVVFKPIGVVHTSFKLPEDTKKGATDIKARIEINKELSPGLKGLNEFSHIIVVFNFHRSKGFELFVRPLKYNPEDKTVGVFATHSPFRPNAIGVSVVKLLEIRDNVLFIQNRDMIDKTPVLDIKPYLEERIDNAKFGWYVYNKNGGDI